jgi:hypothetical protein
MSPGRRRSRAAEPVARGELDHSHALMVTGMALFNRQGCPRPRSPARDVGAVVGRGRVSERRRRQEGAAGEVSVRAVRAHVPRPRQAARRAACTREPAAPRRRSPAGMRRSLVGGVGVREGLRVGDVRAAGTSCTGLRDCERGRVRPVLQLPALGVQGADVDGQCASRTARRRGRATTTATAPSSFSAAASHDSSLSSSSWWARVGNTGGDEGEAAVTVTSRSCRRCTSRCECDAGDRQASRRAARLCRCLGLRPRGPTPRSHERRSQRRSASGTRARSPRSEPTS